MIADVTVSYPGKKQLLGKLKRAAIPPFSGNSKARECVFVRRAHSHRPACMTTAGTCCFNNSQATNNTLRLSSIVK